MINVSRIMNPVPANQVVRYAGELALADGITGASTGGGKITLHVVNPALEALAQAVLAAMDSLIVAVDKAIIAADDVDTAVVSMATSDVALDWLLIQDDMILGSGTEAAAAGVVSLDFSIDTPGVYDIWLVRRVGDYATGKVTVEAQ